jgi:hypothetical protein
MKGKKCCGISSQMFLALTNNVANLDKNNFLKAAIVVITLNLWPLLQK